MKKIIYSVLFAVMVAFASCKEHQSEGQDVGAGVQNGESYSNEQNSASGNQQEDHPGQNIGSHSDSTSVQGEPGNPSNY